MITDDSICSQGKKREVKKKEKDQPARFCAKMRLMVGKHFNVKELE